jgi:hypothetical protein
VSARIRLHKRSGTATLSGIGYADLRHLLTLAANSAYDRLDFTTLSAADKAHYEGVLKLIKSLEDSVNRQGYPMVPRAQLSKESRRALIANNLATEALVAGMKDALSARRLDRSSPQS